VFERDAARIIARKRLSSFVARSQGFRYDHAHLVPASLAERFSNSLKDAIFCTSLRRRLAAKSHIFMFCRGTGPLRSEKRHEP
jgi:hypothetical protein